MEMKVELAFASANLKKLAKLKQKQGLFDQSGHALLKKLASKFSIKEIRCLHSNTVFVYRFGASKPVLQTDLRLLFYTTY